MIICKHRVNTSSDLKLVSKEFGIEIDLRSNLDELYLSHDPFTAGEKFEDWLEHFNHAFLIVNVKEEGLEFKVKELLSKHGISKWVFLDQSFPFFVKELKSNSRNSMVRISEYESVQDALKLGPKPEWAWLDSFHGKYPHQNDLAELKKSQIKIMLVSPELQGRDSTEDLEEVHRFISDLNFKLDGVCTKLPDLWKKLEEH